MALESIVSFHEQYPNVFFTYPVSQGSPDKWDWRMEYEDQEVGALDWEIDFGSAPMKALKQIGGFDETLDDGRWGFDNVNVGLRASLAGYKIRNCPRTCAYGLPHERESFRDMRDVLYHNERLDEFRHGLTLPPLEQGVFVIIHKVNPLDKALGEEPKL